MSEPLRSGRITLVGGGARSGKSRFALTLARQRGPRRIFIATAQAFDAEMHVRISAHAAERGDDFETCEVPLELARAIEELPATDVVVIDCITLWLSNMLLADHSAAQIGAAVETLCERLRECRADTILVTNEVGMGIVPDTALGRAFRDIAGTANQRLSAIADELHWAMLGTILQLRPEPLRVHNPWSTP